MAIFLKASTFPGKVKEQKQAIGQMKRSVEKQFNNAKVKIFLLKKNQSNSWYLSKAAYRNYLYTLIVTPNSSKISSTALWQTQSHTLISEHALYKKSDFQSMIQALDTWLKDIPKRETNFYSFDSMQYAQTLVKKTQCPILKAYVRQEKFALDDQQRLYDNCLVKQQGKRILSFNKNDEISTISRSAAKIKISSPDLDRSTLEEIQELLMSSRLYEKLGETPIESLRFEWTCANSANNQNCRFVNLKHSLVSYLDFNNQNQFKYCQLLLDFLDQIRSNFSQFSIKGSHLIFYKAYAPRAKYRVSGSKASPNIVRLRLN